MNRTILLLLTLMIQSIFAGDRFDVMHKYTYEIRGYWLYSANDIFQQGKGLKDLKAATVPSEIQPSLANIIDFTYISEIGSIDSVVDQINSYLVDFPDFYDEYEAAVDEALSYLIDKTIEADSILTYSARKLKNKAKKNQNEKIRLGRILIELIYPDILARSSIDRKGIWHWTVYIPPEQFPDLAIYKVTYVLPSFFEDNVLEVTSSANGTYPIEQYSTGEVEISTEIEFHKNTSPLVRKYRVRFDAEESNISESITFEQRIIRPTKENNIWDWYIFVNTPDENLVNSIEFIEYTLHDSYNEPIQIRENPENRFQINAQGVLNVSLRIKVVMNDGSVFLKQYKLQPK